MIMFYRGKMNILFISKDNDEKNIVYDFCALLGKDFDDL